MKKMIIILALLLGFVPEAGAQVTYDGCVDFRGIPVASVRNDMVRDVAVASLAPNGAPIITYNVQVLSWFQPQTRLFWYGHECGHHRLRHLAQSVRPGQEQEADCFSIVFLVREGALSAGDVAVIQSDLSRLGGGDWTHLPGQQRAINLQACLRSAGISGSGTSTAASTGDDDDAWSACYDSCQARMDRCTDRCSAGSGWDRCYDRCSATFDHCTNRC
jgi:hypothetical protein